MIELGGTHNSMAPPSHFLQRAYGRVVAAMGAVIDIRLNRLGFYPAGGGEVEVDVQPCSALPMALAGGGSFTADRLSLHAITNAEAIARFLPVRFAFESTERLHTVRIAALAS